MIVKILTRNREETKERAKRLARALRGDETLAFTGDLGSGKTTFIQGLAQGLGIGGKVISPTFVLQRIYRGKFPLFHYDFYRLTEKEIWDLDLEESWGRGVVAIEWAEKLKKLPPQTIKIKIKEKGKNKREFVFHLPSERSYLSRAL